MRGVTELNNVPISSIRTFQLTRLMRGVTIFQRSICLACFISTHTPHARRDQRRVGCIGCPMISTHTPHARRDSAEVGLPLGRRISTHTPHARRDYFQSTFTEFFLISTHTPHARRDNIHLKILLTTTCISTHTPHARRD